MYMKKSRHAFTLIELLVTISIIGVLSMLALVAVNAVREAGRDAKRKTDLETIRTALELYKADAGVYPTSPLSTSITYETKIYLASVPTDPTTGRIYLYSRPTTATYYLCVALEGATTAVNCASGSGSVYCGGTTPCTYETSNP